MRLFILKGSPLKVLVTGSKGFIGKNLCKSLTKLNRSLRGTVRKLNSLTTNCNYEIAEVGDISTDTNWKNALEDVSCIIHCAGKAHAMYEKENFNKSILSVKELFEAAKKIDQSL